MSRNSTTNPRLERCIQHKGNHPENLQERTVTPVERPLMATQARSQWLTSQGLLEDIRETPEHERSKDKALAPESLPSDPSEPISTNQEKISNLELHTTLLALSRNNQP